VWAINAQVLQPSPQWHLRSAGRTSTGLVSLATRTVSELACASTVVAGARLQRLYGSLIISIAVVPGTCAVSSLEADSVTGPVVVAYASSDPLPTTNQFPAVFHFKLASLTLYTLGLPSGALRITS
jgi:hypothetical protein